MPTLIVPDNKPAASSFMTFPFLEYAAINWYRHITHFSESNSQTWVTLGKILVEPHVDARMPWLDRSWRLQKDIDMTPRHSSSRLKESFTRFIDDTTLWSLVTTIFYASRCSNDSITCRAMPLFGERGEDQRLLSAMLHYMVIGMKHDGCLNRRIPRVHKRLNHQTLVAYMTKCIADGARYWVRFEDDDNRECDCSEIQKGLGIHAEVCKILYTGHNILPHSVLRVFAYISALGTNNMTSLEACASCNADPQLVSMVKSPFRKKSGIDLPAEGDGFALIQSFSQWLDDTMETDITEATVRSMLPRTLHLAC